MFGQSQQVQGGLYTTAQEVSRRIPTMGTWDRSQVVVKLVLQQAFFEYFAFPCQFSFKLLHIH
jgi:hypothetical protein